MVKVWDVDGRVDNQVEHPLGLWVIISNHTTPSLISLTSKWNHHSPQQILVIDSLK
jgi:hypothetical protein